MEPTDAELDAHFTALSPTPANGELSDDDLDKHFDSLGPGSALPAVATPPKVVPATGLKRLQIIPESLASGAYSLLGLPGDLEKLGKEKLPKSITTLLSNNGQVSSQLFPTSEEMMKTTGLGMSQRPDLAPQNPLERYGSAAIASIPSLALMGPEKLAQGAVSAVAGALSAQGAHDIDPDSKVWPVVAGVVGALGGGGVANWGAKYLENKSNIRLFADAQSELDEATQHAAKLGDPSTKNSLAVKDSAVANAQQASDAATRITAASRAKLDATKQLAVDTTTAADKQTGEVFQNTAGLLGKSKDVEQAGKSLQAQARNWLDVVMPAKLKAVAEPLEAAVPGETPVQLDNFTHALEKITGKAGSLQPLADEMAEGLPARLKKVLDQRNGKDSAAEDLADLTGGEPPVPTPPPTWNDTRAIRTMLGDAMADPSALKGISQQNVSYLYKALTADLGSAAAKVGAGDVWKAYNAEASRLYGLAGGVMSKITTTGKEGLTAGKVAKSLLAEGGTDSSNLAALRAEIPVGADELAAAQLRQGGEAWRKLSPASRQALVPATDQTSYGVLDQALEAQGQARANAKSVTEAAQKEHDALVAAAKEDARTGKFTRTNEVREASRADAQARYDANQRLIAARNRVSEAQGKLPEQGNSMTNSLNKATKGLRNWTAALSGAYAGPLIASHFPSLNISPEMASLLGVSTLGAPVVARGLAGAVRNPGQTISGVVSGQNSLSNAPSQR